MGVVPAQHGTSAGTEQRVPAGATLATNPDLASSLVDKPVVYEPTANNSGGSGGGGGSGADRDSPVHHNTLTGSFEIYKLPVRRPARRKPFVANALRLHRLE